MTNVVGIRGDGDKKPPPTDSDLLEARDTLSARVTQVQAICSVLAQAFGEDDDEERAPGNHIVRNTLWAVGDLLDQADEARGLIEDHLNRLNGVT